MARVPLAPLVNDIGSVSVAASQVTVTNTSTVLAAARERRKRLILYNKQPVDVYIEGGTATTLKAVLPAGASITLYTVSAVEGITSAAYTATGDYKVHVIEEYDA